MKSPFSRLWMMSALVLAVALLSARAPAQDQSSNAVLSATTSNTRAAWQQHLTVGPGDVLSFSLYGEPIPLEVWPSVVVGPDGRISYLEARDIPAAGLTIDELRTNVESALLNSSNYQSVHVMITPVAFTSKKYYVLGAVIQKGVFTMDRPITVIEAIARAGGLETGVFERNTIELADLSHSFLERNGQRVPIDFEKLFQQGDLSQNVPVEPGDYLYFASSGANEIYVLGQVQSPGTVPFSQGASIIGAITRRGSFTTAAYRQRILIVRGSLTHPQTFVINTADILKGKDSNFRLMPRDIIYVSAKPWQIAEDLLDQGTQAFITSMVVTYTGAKLGIAVSPLIH